VFPFLAFASFLVAAYLGMEGRDLITQLPWPRGHIWFLVSYGTGGFFFVVILAIVLSLPFVVIYRSRAALIAILALLPTVTLFILGVAESTSVVKHPYMSFTGYVWPWICTAIAITFATNHINPWSPRWPSNGADTPSSMIREGSTQ